MVKKTYNEKLHHAGDLPKKEFIGPDNKMALRWGVGHMVIASPIEYDYLMKKVPHGKVVTTDHIRKTLAKKHRADFTCPLTAGIFINIVAHASQERENAGIPDITPYWRTLKKDGELNDKYPGGIDHQKILLQMEGHKIINKGKRYFLNDFLNALYEFKD